MKSKAKKLKGEVDYDYKNDILFFKTKNREYVKSIELDNIVLDVDSKGKIVGIQILEASEFLRMKKMALQSVAQWEFDTRVEKIKKNKKEFAKIEVRLTFQVKIRNRLIEKNPIIMPQQIREPLPNSELVCVA